MAKIKKLAMMLAMVIVVGVGFSSCDNSDYEPVISVDKQIVDTSENSFQARASNSLVYDKTIRLNLKNYVHLIEERHDYGLCGVMTLVVGRHLKNTSHPATSSEVKEVIKSRGKSPDLYQLWQYTKQDSKSLLKERSGNRLFGEKRDKMKEFIYKNLLAGNPVMAACMYNMGTDPYGPRANHFYLIVGLRLYHHPDDSSYTYGGTGTKVLVKDVWRGGRSDEDCSKTLEFDYSAFLSSVWYSTQRDYQSDGTFEVEKGSERYCALALTQ